ncbi:unnamed protein product [Lactuca saligna]|uniref:Uncharacterized protein n=1 Tax=Lactuca saligna TaxID=75948 RepID=A0AA35VWM3_LACSI|nr:unnamed protein product [Lactuca saligna]
MLFSFFDRQAHERPDFFFLPLHQIEKASGDREGIMGKNANPRNKLKIDSGEASKLPSDPLKAKSDTLFVNKFESEVKSPVIKGSSDVSKSEGPRSGVNLVDSLLDAGCDAISIENKGLGLLNGSEGVVMGSNISSKVVMVDIAGSPMVNNVIRNPIKEDGVIEGLSSHVFEFEKDIEHQLFI